VLPVRSIGVPTVYDRALACIEMDPREEDTDDEVVVWEEELLVVVELAVDMELLVEEPDMRFTYGPRMLL
jgi:hypothetical protein